MTANLCLKVNGSNLRNAKANFYNLTFQQWNVALQCENIVKY